jgi:hypothetical protein
LRCQSCPGRPPHGGAAARDGAPDRISGTTQWTRV